MSAFEFIKKHQENGIMKGSEFDNEHELNYPIGKFFGKMIGTFQGILLLLPYVLENNENTINPEINDKDLLFIKDDYCFESWENKTQVTKTSSTQPLYSEDEHFRLFAYNHATPRLPNNQSQKKHNKAQKLANILSLF